MRFPVAVVFSCLLASSLHAGNVLDQDLVLQFYLNGNKLAESSSTTDPSVELNTLDFGGWQGTASLVSSGAPQLTDTLPYTLALTSVDLTCVNPSGCVSAGFHFTDSVTFSDAKDFFNQPYSISVQGSGIDTFIFLSGQTGGLDAVGQVNAFLQAGQYDFKTSGIIGNVSVGGLKGASFGDNITNPVSFQISGSFDMLPGEFNQTVSLPHSFELMLGPAAAAPTDTPEPGSLALAGGFLLTGLAALAWRRVRN